MNEGPRTPRLAAAAALGFLLLNYPLLSLFDSPARVLGVPPMWAYLFTAWALLIGLVALIVRRQR
jgi:hypothetical protein